jgi:hypothetical protein
MQARYFYAPAIFSSAPKLFVLTPDCILYSESRHLSMIQIERSEVSSFTGFKPGKFETEDHPVLVEISSEEIKEISVTPEANWINRYLLEKKIFSQKPMQA